MKIKIKTGTDFGHFAIMPVSLYFGSGVVVEIHLFFWWIVIDFYLPLHGDKK